MPSSSIHVVTDGKISFIYGCLLFCCLVAQRLKRLPAMRETRVRSLGWEDPLEKEVAPHCNILAWRIPWREEPGRHSPRGCKESDTTELLHFHSSVACACVCVCCIFIHLGHVDHFHILAVVIMLQWTQGCIYLFRFMFFFSSDKYLKVLGWPKMSFSFFSIRCYGKPWMNFLANPIELLHQLEILSSIFKENFKMFFTVVEAVYIPTNTTRVILTLWSYWGPGVLILTLVTYCLSGSNSTYLGRKEKVMEEWWQSQSSE